MNEVSDIRRTKPRFDPAPKKTLFDRILWPLKAVLGGWVLFFAFLVAVIVVLAAFHFSRPRVFELEIRGLPAGVDFVALVNEDETGLIEHNFPFERLGGTVDHERRAIDSWASYVANHAAGGPVRLPLDGKPSSASCVLIRRGDGRLQRATLEGLEGSWGSWKLDLDGRAWRDCEPDLLRRVDVGGIYPRPAPARGR